MTPLDRRAFLKAAGSGVGTLALAGERRWSRQRSTRSARFPRNSEIVVIGAGAFGGWTALYLREMGFSVTLVDQYGPGNSRATSGGETRQIRAGYGEREIYTRWVLAGVRSLAGERSRMGQEALLPHRPALAGARVDQGAHRHQKDVRQARRRPTTSSSATIWRAGIRR